MSNRFFIDQLVIAEVDGHYTNGVVKKIVNNMVTVVCPFDSKVAEVEEDCIINPTGGHPFHPIALNWWSLNKPVWWEIDRWVFLLNGRIAFYGQEIPAIGGMFLGETKECTGIYAETFGELLCWWSSLQPETNY